MKLLLKKKEEKKEKWIVAVDGERERERIQNTEILFNKAIAPFEGV